MQEILDEESSTLFLMVQVVAILGSEAHGVNVTGTQLYHCHVKVATDDGKPMGPAVF